MASARDLAEEFVQAGLGRASDSRYDTEQWLARRAKRGVWAHALGGFEPWPGVETTRYSAHKKDPGAHLWDLRFARNPVQLFIPEKAPKALSTSAIRFYGRIYSRGAETAIRVDGGVFTLDGVEDSSDPADLDRVRALLDASGRIKECGRYAGDRRIRCAASGGDLAELIRRALVDSRRSAP